MSESLILTVLSLAELAVVTAGIAIYLFIRNRNISKRLSNTMAAMRKNKAAAVKNEVHYADFLQQYIDHTNEKLSNMPPDHAGALQARVAFLQAEVNAQKQAENSDAYWNQLIHDLDEFLPHDTLTGESSQDDVPGGGDDHPILNELDDIDIQSDIDNIPTLDKNLSQGNGVRKDPTLTIESSNEDLERLRKIISRQHSTMDELKKSLTDKDIDIENNHELSKKLEEVEIAQAQLNMCVETLEKENDRLHELIKKYEDSPQQEQLQQAKQDLEDANDRISSLEKENTLQAERIEVLESEISELQKELDQRNVELSRLQSREADLSQTNEPDEHNQDSLMKEIETLTDLITQKSEELSKLQIETAQDFDFSAELPELTADEAFPDKAVKSR